MSGARLTKPIGACPGFLTIEVAMAMIILALLLVPLATGMQSAMDRSVRVRTQANALSARSDG